MKLILLNISIILVVIVQIIQIFQLKGFQDYVFKVVKYFLEREEK